jgi:flavin reductase (DIM6/NTAB) family NADH-FMN oxidoreductase RutF
VSDRGSGDRAADQRAFRDCVGTFATGVTVVAGEHRGERAGMTLNAFTSVSLDPLMVCVSLAHGTRTHAVACGSEAFTVSILGSDQESVARRFAIPGSSFPDDAVSVDGGAVQVERALAVLHSRLHHRVPAGDHDILIGTVESFRSRPGEPLLYHRGAFGAIDRSQPMTATAA